MLVLLGTPSDPARIASRVAKRTLATLTLLTALLAAACSDPGEVDCRELARHEARLLVQMLPAEVRIQADRGIAAQRDALARRCEEAPPTEAVARCQLAAEDIAAHRLCSEGE